LPRTNEQRGLLAGQSSNAHLTIVVAMPIATATIDWGAVARAVHVVAVVIWIGEFWIVTTVAYRPQAGAGGSDPAVGEPMSAPWGSIHCDPQLRPSKSSRTPPDL
jgi:hypothetical protein